MIAHTSKPEAANLAGICYHLLTPGPSPRSFENTKSRNQPFPQGAKTSLGDGRVGHVEDEPIEELTHGGYSP